MTAIIVIIALILAVAIYGFAVRENSKSQPETTWKISESTTRTK